MCFEEITNYVGGRLRLGDGPAGEGQASACRPSGFESVACGGIARRERRSRVGGAGI